MQPLGTKKVTQPLSTKKITQPLRTKKSHNLLVQQKITQPLGGKNVLKIQILVTIKLQEIGTGHLGLVLYYCYLYFWISENCISHGIEMGALI